MGVRITLNQQAIAKIGNAILKAADLTMESLMLDVRKEEVMPFNVGTMQNTNTFVETSQSGDKICSSLVTTGPQPRRLYHNPQYNFQTVNNHNAQGYWLEDWIDGSKKDFVRDTYAESLKKEADL